MSANTPSDAAESGVGQEGAGGAGNNEPSWVAIKSEIQQLTQKWRDLQRLARQVRTQTQTQTPKQSQGLVDEMYALSLGCRRDIAQCLRHISRAKNGEPIKRKRKTDKEDEEDEREFGRFSTSSYAQAPQQKKRRTSHSQQQQQQELTGVTEEMGSLRQHVSGQGSETTPQQQQQQQQQQYQYSQYSQQQAQAPYRESPVGGGLKPNRRVFVYSNNDKNYILAKVVSYDRAMKSYLVADADKESKNSFMVPESYVTPLPKVPVLDLDPGTRVMALYHPSTCFYPGVITQKAQPNVKEYTNNNNNKNNTTQPTLN